MSQEAPVPMTSNRPYLIRAMYEWISDNGMSPYLLVEADAPGVQVPPDAVREGKVVLNVAARAVAKLDLGNAQISFLARFGGVSRSIVVPVAAVQAIYAQETGQGMMLPPDAAPTADAALEPIDGPGAEPEPPKRGAHLRVVK